MTDRGNGLHTWRWEVQSHVFPIPYKFIIDAGQIAGCSESAWLGGPTVLNICSENNIKVASAS